MTKKRLISTLLILIMVLTIIPSTHSQAKETAPNAPVISVKSVSGKSGSSNITITIEKTTGAQGYKIMLKAPGEKKFKSVKTLKKDGTAVRSYTVTNVSEGKYSFKVKAYTKTKSKTVWSKYSKTQTVSVSKTTASSKPISISIALPGEHEHLKDSSKKTENKYYEKLVKDIESYTNTKLDIKWRNPDEYFGELELMFLTNSLPDVFICNKSIFFNDLADNGNIWDLTPYIDEYDNLSTIPAYTRQNASYNGRMYSIPRSLIIARSGFGYRLDWLNNLGLKEPETWEEFKAMLYAFTYNDPDGNGIDDTVGLGIDSWSGAFNIMMTWFGVPNEWGLDAKGNLVNKVETKEYIEALKAFRELVEAGVINFDPYHGYYFSDNKIPDFRDIRPGNARTDLINTGLAGCSVQVLDALRLSEEYFEQNKIGLATSDNPIFKLQGYVDTGKGALCLPTTGMSNMMIVISKKNIKTEDQLRQVLQFLNDINDGEMLNLIDYGYEGVTWKKDGDGHISQYTSEQLKKKDLTGDFRNGFNQLASYYTAPENNRSITLPQTKTQILEQKLYEEDIKYIVPNYGIGYTSMTYIVKGRDLDDLIAEAQLDFIVGEIDEAELKTKIKQWKEIGGDEITKEMNKLDHKN